MTNLKISQLPAASAITGAELIELVQGGANVQSTAQAVVGAQASPYAVMTGIPTENWIMGICNGNTGTLPTVFGPGNSAQSVQSFSSNGAGLSGRASNPASSSMYTATGLMVQPQSATALNAACEITFSNRAQLSVSYRKGSGGLPNAGFTWVFVGGFDTVRSDQTAFFGMGTTGLFGGSAVPSALLNTIGFGKDQGDLNLQFMVNNGAGSAAKTDTGLVFTSLVRHLLKITITCDTLGALVTATIQDLEINSPFATKTYTVADGATKNPVADTPLTPHMYIGTGGATSTLVVMGWSSMFLANSFIGY